jgi:predicted CXXCH cytochrome family protein
MRQERAMGVAQSTGDCNSCHTEKGAPGRIMLP